MRHMTIPVREFCKLNFKDSITIQNGRQKSTPNFFVGANTIKLKVRSYSIFSVTFLIIWRSAGDFFKVLIKFKRAATDQLQIVGGR